MIIIKPIPEQYKNADLETKRQLWEINVAEALKEAVSEQELAKKTNDQIELNNRLVSLFDLVKGLRKDIESLKEEVRVLKLPKFVKRNQLGEL